MNFADIPHYVIQRVNYNFKCFYKTEDLQYYLELLKEISENEKVSIHAYALMSNHVHLLITSKYQDDAARMVKLLAQHYTQYFNGEYSRKGPLWGDRFRPCLVDAQHYLLACQRYIELSPVREGLVTHPAEYIWSSYSVNALGERSDVLTPHAVYNALGTNKPHRIEAYRQLFCEELETRLKDTIGRHTASGYCLGGEGFKREISKMLGRRQLSCKADGPMEKIQVRSYDHRVRINEATENSDLAPESQ
jgi:putative transposase